jgi:hypothetical protein
MLMPFFAVVSNGVCTYSSVAFLDNFHKQFQCHLLLSGGEGIGPDWVVDMVVVELCQFGDRSFESHLPKLF